MTVREYSLKPVIESGCGLLAAVLGVAGLISGVHRLSALAASGQTGSGGIVYSISPHAAQTYQVLWIAVTAALLVGIAIGALVHARSMAGWAFALLSVSALLLLADLAFLLGSVGTMDLVPFSIPTAVSVLALVAVGVATYRHAGGYDPPPRR